MNAVYAFLTAAGSILAAGTVAVEDAIKIADLIGKVRQQGEPTDADWAALHEYEAEQTAILDAPMEGEK